MCPKRKFSEYENPEKVAAFSPKNGINVNMVSYASCRPKYIFNCSECGNEFTKTIREITMGSKWCPCCNSGHMCNKTGCEVCFKKSFKYNYPDMARLWSDKNDVGPESLSKGSDTKVWFDCNDCRHSSLRVLRSVVKEHECVYCSTRKLCADTSECDFCYKKTFAYVYPEKAIFWSSKNDTPASQWPAGTNASAWFDCNTCEHSFKKNTRHVGKGSWCKYCANRAMCDDSGCTYCTSKSITFALPHDEIRWSSRNTMSPDRIYRFSNSKAYFQCATCDHEFESTISHVAYGGRCSACKNNKNMMSIIRELKTYEDVTFEVEEYLKYNGRRCFWDTTVTTKWGIFRIESDGRQHFSVKYMMAMMRTKNADTGLERLKDQRIMDHLKEEYIRNNDLLLFRVSYRQLGIMDRLVKMMMSHVEHGTTGVVYMDTLYDDWGPIE